MANKKPTTQVNTYDELLAKAAVASAAKAQKALGTSAMVSVKGGQLALSGVFFPGGSAPFIVLDDTELNAYYPEKYDPNSIKSPACFAFGNEDGSPMKPHEIAAKPQHTGCADCRWNQFKSADNGRGKACKNTQRLALLLAGTFEGEKFVPAKDLSERTLCFLQVPATSLKNWASYVQQLSAGLKRPPFGVVTRITSRPHATNQLEVVFECVRALTNDELGGIVPRVDEAKAAIRFPYEPGEDAPAAPAKGAPAPAKKNRKM